MQLEQILYDKKDGIGRITLNRPEKRNATTRRMMAEIVSVLTEIEADPAVRVVILKGAGTCFSSGHDWKDGDECPPYSLDNEWFQQRRKAMDQLDVFIRRFWELPQPVIAQVHGACIVWGLVMAMNCDLVVAAEDAQFLYRAPGGSGKLLHMFPFLMGMRQCKEILWTKRPVSGLEAAQLGFINKAVPLDKLDQEVENMAREIMKNPAEHITLDKLVVNRCYEIMGLKTALEYANEIHSIGHVLPGSAERWSKLELGSKKDMQQYFGKR